jgi:flagellar basal-body rod protein FlgB
MIGSLFQNTSVPLLEQVVGFAESRHEVLAGNIANLDVPGYQVRDLSVDEFQQMLRDALSEPAPRDVPSQGYYGLPGMDPKKELQRDERLRAVGDDLDSILRHDGNNIGMEQQVREISKNQMMHNLAITILSSQFRLLQTAINERV